ncbi:unnamed protein product [Miscanthus lutarioriparius]|uniref:G domain-containing protein n=1 Tax=Miscanthus lutarioriparius TaxID=422564 RepID=A0A811RPW8_9POAL|nr:unnamed protein product [Miscanthus lutarioriparius]
MAAASWAVPTTSLRAGAGSGAVEDQGGAFTPQDASPPSASQRSRRIRHATLVMCAAKFRMKQRNPKNFVVAYVAAGDTLLGLYEKERLGLSQYADEEFKEESYWETLDADLRYWTRSLRPVQWYPGHIAKTEKELKEQLRLMDVVIEIRNWKRIIVLNREDMISTEDRNAWATYFGNQGTKVVFSNGQLGMGTMKLGRMAKSVASVVNTKRKEKGLLPRPVRAGIVGYPNVGKSSLINRLRKRRMCPAAPRLGVTRELK